MINIYQSVLLDGKTHLDHCAAERHGIMNSGPGPKGIVRDGPALISITGPTASLSLAPPLREFLRARRLSLPLWDSTQLPIVFLAALNCPNKCIKYGKRRRH